MRRAFGLSPHAMRHPERREASRATSGDQHAGKTPEA